MSIPDTEHSQDLVVYGFCI